MVSPVFTRKQQSAKAYDVSEDVGMEVDRQWASLRAVVPLIGDLPERNASTSSNPKLVWEPLGYESRLHMRCLMLGFLKVVSKTRAIRDADCRRIQE